jgi:hypothetical protein
MLICQRNNIKIVQSDDGKHVSCIAPDKRVLETFRRVQAAINWAETTHDFLTPEAMRREIGGAWLALRMPKLDQRRAVSENDRWYVTGYDREGFRTSYAVVEGSGYGTYNGLAFEEL